MRNVFIVFFVTILVCIVGFTSLYSQGQEPIRIDKNKVAPRWHIGEKETTLGDRTGELKASSEAERRAWNKVAGEDKPDKKAKNAEEYLKQFSDGVYAPYAHEIVAVQALRQNQTAKFVKHAEISVAALPESVMLQVELAEVYAEQQKPEDAIRHGEKVLPILTNLIASDEAGGQNIEARRRSMMADTNYALGTAYLFQGYNKRDRKSITKAIGHLENAVRLNNQDERSHFRLAFGYQMTRKTDRALEEYARAVALEGSNAKMARQYLEQAYTKKHGNLVGLEEFIAAQKSQMNAPSLSDGLTPVIPQ
jgi:tetratricopeptide (TPR) repeat protein